MGSLLLAEGIKVTVQIEQLRIIVEITEPVKVIPFFVLVGEIQFIPGEEDRSFFIQLRVFTSMYLTKPSSLRDKISNPDPSSS